MPYSIVLLMRNPFLQTKEIYSEAAGRAFGVPYDGASEMHCVEQTPDFLLVKAGEFLISIHPQWGAYLAKHGEDDVESGAALLAEEQRRWWRQQRAWVSFDLLNETVVEEEAMHVLAKLLLEIVDERSCGVWLPNRGQFLPNDGSAIGKLTELSST
jgi:hypothetical protein